VLNDPDAPVPTSDDWLLGGRVRIRQPRNGARVAIDPIFLAASVSVEPGQVVLDIGCGSGAASLCLVARVPDCRVVGLELQPDLARLAGDNVVANGLQRQIAVIAGDLLRPSPGLVPGNFDHVMANPPFLEHGRASPPQNPAKAAAAIEGEAGLGDWVRFAVKMVRSKGSITFVHRADRLDALLGHLAGRVGDVVIFPLWPVAGRDASRVLVRARKQVAAPARLAAGLVLHEADGRFTAAAEAVLRGGEAMPL
jgi:tRNA1(Val) A37 N6-methylase TrmN6